MANVKERRKWQTIALQKQLTRFVAHLVLQLQHDCVHVRLAQTLIAIRQNCDRKQKDDQVTNEYVVVI